MGFRSCCGDGARGYRESAGVEYAGPKSDVKHGKPESFFHSFQ